MTLTSWLGLAVMIVSEAATLARVEPFWSWNTPIAWTGFILFADGDRLARARQLVDPLGAARVRPARARVDSAVARLRRLQPVHPQLVLHRPARELRCCECSATHGRSRRSGRRFSKARNWSASFAGGRGRTGEPGGSDRGNAAETRLRPAGPTRHRLPALRSSPRHADAGVTVSRAVAGSRAIWRRRSGSASSSCSIRSTRGSAANRCGRSGARGAPIG